MHLDINLIDALHCSTYYFAESIKVYIIIFFDSMAFSVYTHNIVRAEWHMRGLGFFDNAVHSFYTCIFYDKNIKNNHF
jgi:hypothetical protein